MKRPVPVEGKESRESRKFRIDSRDIMRHIRKDQPPATKVHTPKNAYKRTKFDWRDIGAEDEGDDGDDPYDFLGPDVPDPADEAPQTESSSSSHT